jgi:hypothetical protein
VDRLPKGCGEAKGLVLLISSAIAIAIAALVAWLVAGMPLPG